MREIWAKKITKLQKKKNGKLCIPSFFFHFNIQPHSTNVVRRVSANFFILRFFRQDGRGGGGGGGGETKFESQMKGK